MRTNHQTLVLRKELMFMKTAINIKKIIGALIAAAAVCVPLAAQAGVIDAVYTTDIGALIDGNPIKSYNISDSTYIKAEDLRGYGFDVVWDADARTLSITPDDVEKRTILPKEEINIKKSDIPVHQKLYDVYSTDIKTYVNGEEINACNINGETLIKFRDLEKTAYVNYDDEKRLASIDVIKYRLDKAFDAAADKQELTLSDGITYIGQVKDGKRDGIGRTTDKSVQTEFPGAVNDFTTTAYYSDGEIDGMYYSKGSYEYTIGSSLGTYIKDDMGNTKTDYAVVFSNYHTEGIYCSVSTITENDFRPTDGVECRAIVDNDYLYCLKNNEIYEYTTYTGGDVNIAPLENLPKFERFTGRYDVSAVTEDGDMFTLPGGDDYKNSVSMLMGTPEEDKKAVGGIYCGYSADSDWILTKDSKLYGFYYDRSDYSNEKYSSVVLAEDVKAAQAAYLYISQDGTLYEDMHDGNGYRVVDTDVKAVDGTSYVIYLKNDGSVWTYRSNSSKALGSEWGDGMDYSAPVKRADNAVYVSSNDGMLYMYITSDGSLYAFGGSYEGQKGFVQEFNYETYNYETELELPAVKVGDGFVSCKPREVSLALDTEGNLYAWCDNENGVIDGQGDRYILKPVKIAEDVKDYLYWRGNIYIIKNDGTLWHKDGRDENNGDTESGSDGFVQCERVYRKTN